VCIDNRRETTDRQKLIRHPVILIASWALEATDEVIQQVNINKAKSSMHEMWARSNFTEEPRPTCNADEMFIVFINEEGILFLKHAPRVGSGGPLDIYCPRIARNVLSHVH
jgi:hypothetical protein